MPSMLSYTQLTAPHVHRRASFRLLRNVTGRQCRALAEKEVLHVLRHEVLRLFLPGHEAILVEDHLHAVFPELPGVDRHVLVDALTQFAGPGRRVEPRQLFLELDAHHRAAALVGRRPARRRGGTAIGHARDCTSSRPAGDRRRVAPLARYLLTGMRASMAKPRRACAARSAASTAAAVSARAKMNPR